MKHNNIQIIGIPERGEKEQGIETLFEKIMTEKFLNWERGKTTQVQEAQRVPIKMNPKRPTPRNNIIKIPNIYTEPFTPKWQNRHSFQMHMEHSQR